MFTDRQLDGQRDQKSFILRRAKNVQGGTKNPLMSWEGSQMSLSYCWKLTTHWHRTSLSASLSGHFLFTTSTTVPDSLQLYIHVLGLNINFFTCLSICTCDLDNYLSQHNFACPKSSCQFIYVLEFFFTFIITVFRVFALRKKK